MSKHEEIKSACQALGKEAAYREVFRVLKPRGCFYDCFYVAGETVRTDWFIWHLYEPKGFFSTPYETADSLKLRLERQYEAVEFSTVKSMPGSSW